MRHYMSDDPARDAERYMEYLDQRLARLPKCDCCREHIQDDEALHYVSMGADFWLCLECIENNKEYIEVE